MEIQNLKGNNWSARKVDHIYIVSVSNHSNIVETLTNFVQDQNIQAGEVTGIGAVSEATLRFFNPSTKNYVDKAFKEQMEVTNISGNVSEIEGKLTLHLHITLGRRLYRFSRTSSGSKSSGSGRIYFVSIKYKSHQKKRSGSRY
jgi:predicted DNA-binding protein with PD1-like motif